MADRAALAIGAAIVLLPGMAMAQDSAAPAAAPATPPAPTLDSGDTAWMLTSTALVLMMTVPGLALFYGGMVRKMNVLATIMQSFAITCLITVVWMIVGYSLAFTGGNSYFGGFSRFFLAGMGVDTLSGTIPESVFMCFQMTFAIITPALIAGSFADRMKFSALCVFMVLWSILIYSPIAHIMWQSDGLMFKAGILDFAGGTVVHINAGIAGLVSCLVLGKRMGYPKSAMPPHNLVLSVIGASLLWVGWFGFNAGSALTSGGRAGMAMTTTQVATAAAGIAWMLTEWLTKKKPSVLGIISGAVAGLVAITPASGFVTPTGALIIGIVAGVLCFFSATALKHAIGYDDSLDAFGVHCIGGIIGALLTGVFASKSIGGDAAVGLLEGNAAQLWIQVEGVALTLVWSGLGSFILLKIVDMVIGLRVSEDIERDGLDLGLHGETVQ
ncbi:MAG TPA: ammonium transporter [Dongiaceae bacterium]|jgi:Amt family ammonium transporter|nr:ammonium transporter [Dongiaceae bacterium]